MDQLKDVILSTLAEIGDSVPPEQNSQTRKEHAEKEQEEKTQEQNPKEKSRLSKSTQGEESFFEQVTAKGNNAQSSEEKENELLFLNSLRERFLVLFEGFQAPNNTSVEAKLDLTLNFMEYVLSTIDNRIEKLKGK